VKSLLALLATVFCVVLIGNSQKNKITYKTVKNTNIFAILSALFVSLLILFMNSSLKQQNTQLPAMQAVIS
jgi:DMSO/TMAO reductase YedYZ heme-binding membrane subunit